MSDDKRIRIPREKLIAWSQDGEVSRVSWFRHEADFSVEFWVANQPKTLREDRLLCGPCRAVEIAGAGEVWISDCPGGVELHSRTHGDVCGKPDKPDHEHCIALRGPCWHDGSSSAASDFAQFWSGDDGSVWVMLDSWARYESERRSEVNQ